MNESFDDDVFFGTTPSDQKLHNLDFSSSNYPEVESVNHTLGRFKARKDSIYAQLDGWIYQVSVQEVDLELLPLDPLQDREVFESAVWMQQNKEDARSVAWLSRIYTIPKDQAGKQFLFQMDGYTALAVRPQSGRTFEHVFYNARLQLDRIREAVAPREFYRPQSTQGLLTNSIVRESTLSKVAVLDEARSSDTIGFEPSDKLISYVLGALTMRAKEGSEKAEKIGNLIESMPEEDQQNQELIDLYEDNSEYGWIEGLDNESLLVAAEELLTDGFFGSLMSYAHRYNIDGLPGDYVIANTTSGFTQDFADYLALRIPTFPATISSFYTLLLAEITPHVKSGFFHYSWGVLGLSDDESKILLKVGIHP